MNRGIYTGARGLMAATQWMDVVANNLANASTNGFKQDAVAFSDIYRRNMYASGGQGKYLGSLGAGPTLVKESTNFAVGQHTHTGNPLDIAFNDPDSFLAIDVNGRTEFTRSGSLKVNSSRELVSDEGHPVLDNRGNRIQFGALGTVGISPSGDVTQGGVAVAKLGIFEGDFNKVGKNHWASENAVPKLVVNVDVGSVESSNVQPIETMVDLIRINRTVEMSQKSIQSQDELTGKLIEMLTR